MHVRITRQEIVYGAWIWACVVALLPELGFFLPWLGFSGFIQASIILVLALVVLRMMRGPLVLVVIALLALLNGPPGWMAAPMLDAFFSNPGSFSRLLPVSALRSGIMLFALLPLALLHMRATRST